MRVWELGKELGVTYEGGQEAIVKELENMEAKDQPMARNRESTKVSMIIGTLNIRGMGGSEKWNYVQGLIKKERLKMLCLQDEK